MIGLAPKTAPADANKSSSHGMGFLGASNAPAPTYGGTELEHFNAVVSAATSDPTGRVAQTANVTGAVAPPNGAMGKQGIDIGEARPTPGAPAVEDRISIYRIAAYITIATALVGGVVWMVRR